MHPRFQEITAEIARIRADLAGAIESAPEELLSRDPGNGQWSGTRIIEHLGKTEGSTAKMLEGLFAKALADGLPLDGETASLLHSLDHLHVIDRSHRVEAPERLVPAAEANLADAWASLQKVRLRPLAAAATVDGRDISRISWPHPIFGPINGYQWVLFIGQHEERHLVQLREVLRTA